MSCLLLFMSMSCYCSTAFSAELCGVAVCGEPNTVFTVFCLHRHRVTEQSTEASTPADRYRSTKNKEQSPTVR